MFIQLEIYYLLQCVDLFCSVITWFRVCRWKQIWANAYWPIVDCKRLVSCALRVQLVDGAWRCWMPWQSRHRLVISSHCSPVFALPVVGKHRPYWASWQAPQGVFTSALFYHFKLLTLLMILLKTDFFAIVKCIYSLYAHC